MYKFEIRRRCLELAVSKSVDSVLPARPPGPRREKTSHKVGGSGASFSALGPFILGAIRPESQLVGDLQKTQKLVKLMDGERIVFTEESNPQNYLKLIASGEVDETMLEALEDYVRRQKKRLDPARQMAEALRNPKAE
jgi:hypothetical protein